MKSAPLFLVLGSLSCSHSLSIEVLGARLLERGGQYLSPVSVSVTCPAHPFLTMLIIGRFEQSPYNVQQLQCFHVSSLLQITNPSKRK